MSQTFPETVSETLTSLQQRAARPGPLHAPPPPSPSRACCLAPGHEIETDQAAVMAEIRWDDDDDGDIAGSVELEDQTMEEEDEPTE